MYWCSTLPSCAQPVSATVQCCSRSGRLRASTIFFLYMLEFCIGRFVVSSGRFVGAFRRGVSWGRFVVSCVVWWVVSSFRGVFRRAFHRSFRMILSPNVWCSEKGTTFSLASKRRSMRLTDAAYRQSRIFSRPQKELVKHDIPRYFVLLLFYKSGSPLPCNCCCCSG
jgi:hypothetical protein